MVLICMDGLFLMNTRPNQILTGSRRPYKSEKPLLTHSLHSPKLNLKRFLPLSHS